MWRAHIYTEVIGEVFDPTIDEGPQFVRVKHGKADFVFGLLPLRRRSRVDKALIRQLRDAQSVCPLIENTIRCAQHRTRFLRLRLQILALQGRRNSRSYRFRPFEPAVAQMMVVVKACTFPASEARRRITSARTRSLAVSLLATINKSSSHRTRHRRRRRQNETPAANYEQGC